MADGIVSGCMKEWVLQKTSHGYARYKKIEENHYPQGSVLSDCNLDQRWHITRSDSDEELIILNAYYGPAQQHVVDAEFTLCFSSNISRE
jgi:hypothetical protein